MVGVSSGGKSDSYAAESDGRHSSSWASTCGDMGRYGRDLREIWGDMGEIWARYEPALEQLGEHLEDVRRELGDVRL